MDSPEGYLFRTALNLNRKRLRRLAVRARHLRSPAARRDEIEVAEERLDMLRAVRALPRGQREALVLLEWLDLDGAIAGRASSSSHGYARRIGSTAFGTRARTKSHLIRPGGAAAGRLRLLRLFAGGLGGRDRCGRGRGY